MYHFAAENFCKQSAGKFALYHTEFAVGLNKIKKINGFKIHNCGFCCGSAGHREQNSQQNIAWDFIADFDPF